MSTVDLTPAPKASTSTVDLTTPAKKHPPILIGVTGLIGSGKDSFAEALSKAGRYAGAAFADHLKDVVALAYGWDRDLLEGDTQGSREWREREDPFWKITPRSVLQKVGVSMRDLDPDFWVKAAERRVDDSPGRRFIFTDVRFPNEFAMIRARGGAIVRIRRGENPSWWNDATRLNTLIAYGRNTTMNEQQATNFGNKMKRDFTKFEKDYPEVHVSEWASAGEVCDFEVRNDGSLEDLDTAATALMDHYA